MRVWEGLGCCSRRWWKFGHVLLDRCCPHENHQLSRVIIRRASSDYRLAWGEGGYRTSRPKRPTTLVNQADRLRRGSASSR